MDRQQTPNNSPPKADPPQPNLPHPPIYTYAALTLLSLPLSHLHLAVAALLFDATASATPPLWRRRLHHLSLLFDFSATPPPSPVSPVTSLHLFLLVGTVSSSRWPSPGPSMEAAARSGYAGFRRAPTSVFSLGTDGVTVVKKRKDVTRPASSLLVATLALRSGVMAVA